MANHPSAKKRHRQNLKRSERNGQIRARMRTMVKQAREAVATGSDDADARVKAAVRELYRAASKNVLNKRTASRRVARLMKAKKTA